MEHSILFVDDEPNILNAYRRSFRKLYQVTVAEGGEEGLALIRSSPEFSVIVSDMRMPGMDGVEFLAKAKELARNSVRVMLTGNADQGTAIKAINEGDIFRFVNKPCPPEDMQKVLEVAIRQYQLIRAEKEILENTLKGSIDVLIQVLSLSSPKTFGRANRLRALVTDLVKQLDLEDVWEVDSATSLCLLGYITLPENIINKLSEGKLLSSDEKALFAGHPLAGAELIEKIPRMESIARAIRYQGKGFDGSGLPRDELTGTDIPLASRILKIVVDFDYFETMGSNELAIAKLKQQSGQYDPELLDAFLQIAVQHEEPELREISISLLQYGMVLASDIVTDRGILLMCKGQEITPQVSSRLQNFSRNGAIKKTVCVYEQNAH